MKQVKEVLGVLGKGSQEGEGNEREVIGRLYQDVKEIISKSAAYSIEEEITCKKSE